MTAKEFLDKQYDENKQLFIRYEMFRFAEAYHELKRKDQINAFVEWLKDNYGIEIHDMIVQDYLRYGG